MFTKYSVFNEVFRNLRESTIKYTGVLKWFIIIGCLIILLGLTFFLGFLEIDFEYSLLGVPVNSFFGITYLTLFTFGFYLIIFGLVLILPTLDRNNRKGLINYRQYFISFGTLGLVLILYSLLIIFNILTPLNSFHTWFDYFVLGIILFFSNYLIIVFSYENVQDLSNYYRVWILLLSIGIFIEILSILAYWSLLRIIQLAPHSWGDLYFLGLPFLISGGLPFLLYTQSTKTPFSTVLGISSLILVISGLIAYLAPTLALNGIIFPMAIFKYNNYFDFLFYGFLLLVLGASIASFNESTKKYLERIPPILWVFFLVLGLIQYITSILMEITDTHFVELGLDFLFLQSTRGSLLFGMTWDLFLFNSFMTTLPSLVVLSSLILLETELAHKKQDIEEPS
jgi:hypothetical protein